MISILAIGLALAGSPGQGAFPAHVELRGRTVLVRDVIAPGSLPRDLGDRVGAMALFDVPSGKDEIMLDDRTMGRILRLRVPILANFMPPVAGKKIVIRAMPTATAHPASECVAATADQVPGRALDGAHVMDSRCIKPRSGLVRYDAPTRSYRLRGALKMGDVLPVIPDATSKTVVPGDRFEIASRVGAVTVRRNVEALQSAGAGERLFVRDSEGQIYPVRQESAQ